MRYVNHVLCNNLIIIQHCYCGICIDTPSARVMSNVKYSSNPYCIEVCKLVSVCVGMQHFSSVSF